MERKPDESFSTYKARRAVANAEVKRINIKAKSGGLGRGARAGRPSRPSIGIKGMASSVNTAYGAGLKRHFDRERAQRA